MQNWPRAFWRAQTSISASLGFPQGIVSTQTKIAEGLDAIEKGADELDVVINVRDLKDRDDDYVRKELNLFVRTIKQKKPDVIVKVILECPLLTREEKVRGANIIADSGGICQAGIGFHSSLQLSYRGRKVAKKGSG